jgi:A/G-specific adenine glycosylase
LGAQHVRDHYAGQLPSSPSLLRQLPGIGRYTAGAIASIAFDLPEPAVDGNVMRVLARLEALHGDPRLEPQAARIWQLASNWVHGASPRRFNQSLMELGALVCVPRAPRCSQCPLLSDCRAHELELTDQLPELPTRPKPELRRVVVLVVARRETWLVIEQPDSARHWAGLSTFPYAELRPTDEPRAAAKRLLAQLDPNASLVDAEPLAHFTYPITRFRFRAIVYGAKAAHSKPQTKLGGRYASTEQLAHFALPAPHRRLFDRLRRGSAVRADTAASR